MSRFGWPLLLVLLAPLAAAQPFPTDRDRILSEADTYYNCDWYCSSANIYPRSTGLRCDYTTPGWQHGVAYEWGGYSTLDQFLDGIAAGLGAGNVNSSEGDHSSCVGVDCSGYVSRLWECGRYATASFANASDPILQRQLRMGDATNYAGHHIRLFVRWEDATHIWVYESTTGVDPGRVTERVIEYLPSSTYLPIRYHRDATNRVRIDPEPTIQWVVASGASGAWIPFDGEADLGYRIEHSTDGATWETLQTESTLGSAAFRADVTGLAPATNHFFRVIAVNAGSTVTAPSDTLALRLGQAGAPKVLLVDGMDRWRTLNGDHPGHTFLVGVAQSLGRLGIPYESCSNEMVATGMVHLSDYAAVIWLVGEDSTADESISRGEQFHIQRYLEGGGQLFLSGSEIAWDLDHRGSETRFQDRTDESFMTGYLHLGFASDGANGNGYQVTCLPGTPLTGADVQFDDGTHGTYNVRYPDAFTAQGGAIACMNYAVGGAAAVSYEGTFGTGTATGRVVTLGFGLETVWNDAERDTLIRKVLIFFGLLDEGEAMPSGLVLH
jgi:hypothetical protein